MGSNLGYLLKYFLLYELIVTNRKLFQLQVGGEVPTVSVVGPDGRIVRRSIFDGQNGTYKVVWKPSVVGEHFISVTVKDIHIQQSPFRVSQMISHS